jgi:hypothetical protein
MTPNKSVKIHKLYFENTEKEIQNIITHPPFASNLPATYPPNQTRPDSLSERTLNPTYMEHVVYLGTVNEKYINSSYQEEQFYIK